MIKRKEQLETLKNLSVQEQLKLLETLAARNELTSDSIKEGSLTNESQIMFLCYEVFFDEMYAFAARHLSHRQAKDCVAETLIIFFQDSKFLNYDPDQGSFAKCFRGFYRTQILKMCR